MILLFTLFLVASQLETPGGQAFRLGAGEYRWVPFSVNQAPSEVEIRYEVLKGSPTVHVELLAIDDFREFNRGKPHHAIAASEDAQLGSFQKLILVKGRYAAVVANSKAGALSTVSLGLRVEANPKGAIARELPQQKRLTIIFLSFLVFVATVTWSTRKLFRAMQGV